MKWGGWYRHCYVVIGYYWLSDDMSEEVHPAMIMSMVECQEKKMLMVGDPRGDGAGQLEISSCYSK